MKQEILHSIYQSFDSWTTRFEIACRQGCTACCTQDVTMTALEADNIFRFIATNSMEKWLVAKLAMGLPDTHPSITTNEYAKSCLDGTEIAPGLGSYNKVCPFLENGACAIYDARPFSCRCFISTQTCKPGTSASAPQYFMAAATAVSQIIEHLGQGEYWGNMLHILYLIAQQSGKISLNELDDFGNQLLLARTSCLWSKPLPGFLIGEDDYPLVVPLLEQIFATDIGEKTIEDILNNK